MKIKYLIFLFACEEITTIKNEPILMAELKIVESFFEKEGLKWNPNNLPFRLVFDEMEVWGRIDQTNTYFKISINPNSPDYLITILVEVGHLNGLQHGDGVIMTYGILSITSAVWPWNKDEYLNEYFKLIKRWKK